MWVCLMMYFLNRPFYDGACIFFFFLLALHFFVSFGLLINYFPCFSTYSHLTPILNLHFFQIRYDIILPSWSLFTNPPYWNCSPLHYSLHCPFFIHSYNMSNPSYSLSFWCWHYMLLISYCLLMLTILRMLWRKCASSGYVEYRKQPLL